MKTCWRGRKSSSTIFSIVGLRTDGARVGGWRGVTMGWMVEGMAAVQARWGRRMTATSTQPRDSRSSNEDTVAPRSTSPNAGFFLFRLLCVRKRHFMGSRARLDTVPHTPIVLISSPARCPSNTTYIANNFAPNWVHRRRERPRRASFYIVVWQFTKCARAWWHGGLGEGVRIVNGENNIRTRAYAILF